MFTDPIRFRGLDMNGDEYLSPGASSSVLVRCLGWLLGVELLPLEVETSCWSLGRSRRLPCVIERGDVAFEDEMNPESEIASSVTVPNGGSGVTARIVRSLKSSG